MSEYVGDQEANDSSTRLRSRVEREKGVMKHEIKRTYRYRLYPNQAQKAELERPKANAKNLPGVVRGEVSSLAVVTYNPHRL